MSKHHAGTLLSAEEAAGITCTSTFMWRLVAVFMSAQEQVILARAAHALHTELQRDLAATCLQRGVRQLRQQAWMNKVLNDVNGFHAFVSRLDINLPELSGFGCGLAGLAFLRRRRRDVRLSRVCLCPQCQLNPIDAACYFAIGHKMKNSKPYLRFGCHACILSNHSVESLGIDTFQGPVIASLTTGVVSWSPAL
jgi:hypothetical protein